MLECPFCGLHEIDYGCGLRNGKPFAFVRCANCEAGFREDDCCEDLTPEQLLVQLKVAWNDRPIRVLLNRTTKEDIFRKCTQLYSVACICLDCIQSRIGPAIRNDDVRGATVAEVLADAHVMLCNLGADLDFAPPPPPPPAPVPPPTAPTKPEDAADAE